MSKFSGLYTPYLGCGGILEREQQPSVMNSNDNPLAFSHQKLSFPHFPNQLKLLEKHQTSINDRIASLSEKDSKMMNYNEQTKIIKNSNDLQNLPHSMSLKRAWEDKSISLSDMNKLNFKRAQEDSRNYYFKSRTIIGRRVKNKPQNPRLNNNIESFEQFNKDTESPLHNDDQILEFPVIELEESKESSRRQTGEADAQSTNQYNIIHKSVMPISNRDFEGSSFDKAEAFSSRRTYEDKDKVSEQKKYKNKRMTSDIGLLQKRTTTNAKADNEENEQNDAADEESEQLIDSI